MRQLCRATAVMSILAIGMCLPGNGLAQDLKVAVVDIETLTLTSDEGKAVNDKLKKRYDEIVGIMSKLQKDIEDKENRLKTQDRVLSAAAKQQLSREIESDKIAFDRKNQDYQKEMTDYQNELLDPVAGRAQAALQAYIKEKAPTIVIDLSAEKGNVVWANSANDITMEVMKRLNDDYKRSLAATPASTPAATRPAASAPAGGTTRPPAANTPAPAAPKTP
jgi:Skp family chaperone for outer membrane proteins